VNIQYIIQMVSVAIIPMLFAITLHEAAHAWMADKKGDPTARMLGRMTLNPLAHIDPIGTVILPLILLIVYLNGGPGFLFGYAKPVPVNFYKLRRPKTDMAWVAAAGPGMNFILAFVSGVAMRGLEILYPLGAGSPLTPMFVIPLYKMLEVSVTINTVLMVFNFIPIPPLDGGRVLVGLLPEKQSSVLSSVEPFGMWLIFILVFADPLGVMRYLFTPLVFFFRSFFFGAFL
jgi:Zn-dependent protease